MTFILRRVKMDDASNRADRLWLLFEQGHISHPLATLTDYEIDALINQIEEQRDDDHQRAAGRNKQ